MGDNKSVPRVLVTGGAGFIGSHLCRALLSLGRRVICVDNYLSGSTKNVSDLLSNPYFEAIEHDVTSPLNLDVDQIFNLACPASPELYQADPVQTVRTNVMGAINMLELARRLQIPILQASTSEIYGDPTVHPQPESYWGNVNPIGLRSCYNEGKRCAETLFFDYYRQHGVEIKVARIFNTYGPNMHPHDGRVVSSFITQALAGENITIFGDGLQTRSFCYVSDLIDGLIKFMDANNTLTGPVNFGNSHETTIKDLADSVLSLTQSRSQIVYGPLPKDDPRQRQPDITYAEELLDWRPNVTFVDGLQKTIAYYKMTEPTTSLA
jgi:UDP-glucuronate decarboxylase